MKLKHVTFVLTMVWGEGPKLFDMAVNLKAARVLGVTIPDSIVKQAVEVIE